MRGEQAPQIDDADWQKFLSEASDLLNSSLDCEKTLGSLARLAVSRLADWCMIDLLEPDGKLRRVALEQANPDRAELAERLRAFMPRLESRSGAPEVIRTGKPILVSKVEATHMQDISSSEEHFRALDEVGTRSKLFVPLIARGQVLGCVGFVFAESGRHYAERDLEMAVELCRRAAVAVDNARLYEDAQRAIRAREELLAVVSHDFKNPLASIQICASLLDALAPDDESEKAVRMRKAIRLLLSVSGQMEGLLRNLLDFARIEAGGMVLDLTFHGTDDLVREVLEALEPQFAEKGIAFECRVAQGLRIYCDRERILQILFNLVGNALKFTPRGGRIVLEAAEEGDHIGVAVEDTGCGIPAEHLSHVFDRYWQGSGARGGVGLGLAIVRGIVVAHGGQVAVSSRVGGGARFSFTLPRGMRPGLSARTGVSLGGKVGTGY
jgi:signal transduction histidine kinase